MAYIHTCGSTVAAHKSLVVLSAYILRPGMRNGEFPRLFRGVQSEKIVFGVIIMYMLFRNVAEFIVK